MNVINCSAKVQNTTTNQNAGDIDILTDKYFIEVKRAFGEASIEQMKKYTDKYQEQFMNFEGKKVILYVERPIEKIDSNKSIKEKYYQIVGLGVKIINSREELNSMIEKDLIGLDE